MNHYPIGKKILRERLLMLLIQFIRHWVPDCWERYMRFVSVHELYKKDFENFNADAVDQKIAEVVRRVHQSANEDLEQFLFDDTYVAENA